MTMYSYSTIARMFNISQSTVRDNADNLKFSYANVNDKARILKSSNATVNNKAKQFQAFKCES